jgi:hypothetical protein
MTQWDKFLDWYFDGQGGWFVLVWAIGFLMGKYF